MRFDPVMPLLFVSLVGMSSPSQAGDDAYDGLTLYNLLMNANTTYLVDGDGATVHAWTGSGTIASTPYLFQGGDLLRPCKVPGNPPMNGAAVGGRIQRISITNQIVWDYTFSDTQNQQHHDICPMPNGNVLLVAWEFKTNADAQAMGRTGLNGPIWPTQIVEVMPTGTTSGTIVWQWHLWDHLIQDVNAGLPNYGLVADHPERLDINVGNINNGDWIHVNALDYNPELDQIVFSSNSLDEIFIIDHSTTTEEAASSTGGLSGMGGDFLYRWGNSSNYDRGTTSDHVLYNVHGVNWIDPGLEGEGRILLFNNGNDDSTSDLIEFMPPINEDGTYDIDAGQPFAPERDDYAWFYERAGFHGDHLCGVYRLPNGNTLATDGPNSEIREVNAAGDTVWTLFTASRLMRANKYPLDILEEIDGCPADLNDDGEVTGTDLSQLLGFWGLSGDADINGDGSIGGEDLTILLGAWGPCP